MNSKDVTAAVEVLQEAEDVGIDLGNFAYGITVLEKFTIFCSHSIVMLDALYYALVCQFIHSFSLHC